MIKLTRREWHKLVTTGVLTSLAGRQAQSQVRRQESRIAGVLIGVQSYSFRDRDLQGLIDGMVAIGLTSCELWEAHVEPRELRRLCGARLPAYMIPSCVECVVELPRTERGKLIR